MGEYSPFPQTLVLLFWYVLCRVSQDHRETTLDGISLYNQQEQSRRCVGVYCITVGPSVASTI